ncbi:MAG: alpha-glucosidase/alpha-galactosidase, partial [Treponema sp.]|jgi:alpha-galactosidase|nr:alpha-glucosidase/alpha-galactosidase [Treponema sp.]
MVKFAFIGAGSFGFTRTLVRDILTFDAFKDATFALMDVDGDRLGYITRAVEKIIKAGNYGARVISTKSRQEALEGADGVLCTILNGDVDVWRYDIEIPKEYGVDINVGDTRGPSGIFRALRTIPVMLDICKDIEKYCPNAVFLNYTNPMAMLCRAMQSRFPKLMISGLCHSVQGTAEILARWIGAPYDEISFTCAGINHQAFYLDFLWKGKDAYPLIRKAVQDPKIYNEDLVRNEMFMLLDYFPTESSGHNSEYNAWFRKRPDLIEKFCTHGTGWNPGVYAYILKEYQERKGTWRGEIEKWLNDPNTDLKRGHEYAAFIFNAIFGDRTPYKFNGNVLNKGLIDNLPQGACVEVPVLASIRGLEAIKIGKLPDQLVALVHTSSICEELAVEGSLQGDPRKVYQAVAFDPLSSAVLGIQEIKQMTEKMLRQNKDYLPQFSSLSLD